MPSSKQCLIIHVEVPIKLLRTTKRKQTRDFNPVIDPIPKKYKGGKPHRTPNPNTWHPLLNSKRTSPIEVSDKPSLSAALKYCGKTADEVYPLVDRKCSPNALFGKCYLGGK